MKNSETLAKFRKTDKLGTVDSNLDIPAPSQERNVTDKKGFFLYGLAISLYLSLFAYYVTHASRKVQDGQNAGIRYKYVVWEHEARNRNIFDGDFQMHWEYFPKFVAIIVITSGSCILLLYSLLRAATVVIWVIIYNSVIILGTLTYLAWFVIHPPGDQNWNILQNPRLIIPIFFTFLTVLSVFFSCIFHKTLKPLILLYQQVAKVLFSTPTLLTPVIAVIVVQALILFIAVTVAAPLAIATLKDQRNLLMTLLIMTLIMVFWTMQMTAGFQCMTTAGSVASWYFTTFRVFLQAPVLRSVANTAKFHVGTIALGAFCHPFITTAKCLTIWSGLATILEGFSTRNGLVVTALHGQPFFKSARRARDLLEENFLVGLKVSSEFMLWLIRLHLLVYSSVVSFGFFVNSDSPFVPMVICTAVNVIVIFVFFETFEATIYTLLICYCEDKCISNNLPSSYYLITTILDDIFNVTKQERYKKNIILGHRTIATDNNYTIFV